MNSSIHQFKFTGIDHFLTVVTIKFIDSAVIRFAITEIPMNQIQAIPYSFNINNKMF